MTEKGSASCCVMKRSKSNSSIGTVEPLWLTGFPSGKKPTKDKMICIPGGEFLMGTEDNEGFPQYREGPVRIVKVKTFYIDPCTVTNAEFAEFIHDTNYITDAERYG